MVSPQRISSTSCCSLRLSPISLRTCRFYRIASCRAAQRNSAAENRRGLTASPAATARIADSTSTAEASRSTYPVASLANSLQEFSSSGSTPTITVRTAGISSRMRRTRCGSAAVNPSEDARKTEWDSRWRRSIQLPTGPRTWSGSTSGCSN